VHKQCCGSGMFYTGSYGVYKKRENNETYLFLAIYSFQEQVLVVLVLLRGTGIQLTPVGVRQRHIPSNALISSPFSWKIIFFSKKFSFFVLWGRFGAPTPNAPPPTTWAPIFFYKCWGDEIRAWVSNFVTPSTVLFGIPNEITAHTGTLISSP
jgi:hypothetical protein